MVRRVEYNNITDDFTVTTNNLEEKRDHTERFTHVVVSTGVYAMPYVPDIAGIGGFLGRVVHAKDVKHINEF